MTEWTDRVVLVQAPVDGEELPWWAQEQAPDAAPHPMATVADRRVSNDEQSA
jgi:hypothetical protein